MPSPEARVLIAGGGIGGLATAISLGQCGFPVSVLERSAFGEESGAGIQLGPNATRVLDQLGALEAVREFAFTPEAIAIFDAPSGAQLASIPLGQHVERRYRAPYLTQYRADLHAALLSVCNTVDGIALNPGFDVATVEQVGGKVRVVSHEGDTAEGVALIGADGLWSTIRKLVAPDAQPYFAGATAWRTVLPRERLSPPFDAPTVGLWLGPRAHLVHYPVRGGRELNVVAVVEDKEGAQGWNRPGDVASLCARLASWSAVPKSLLQRAESWRCWSLYRMQPLPRWSEGRIALIGDAAHPVLPYLAQGAALAIEDALDVARWLLAQSSNPCDFPTARHRFERACAVQRTAAAYGRRYHLSGWAAGARNLVLRHRRGEALLAQLDWLYQPRSIKDAP